MQTGRAESGAFCFARASARIASRTMSESSFLLRPLPSLPEWISSTKPNRRSLSLSSRFSLRRRADLLPRRCFTRPCELRLLTCPGSPCKGRGRPIRRRSVNRPMAVSGPIVRKQEHQRDPKTAWWMGCRTLGNTSESLPKGDVTSDEAHHSGLAWEREVRPRIASRQEPTRRSNRTEAWQKASVSWVISSKRACISFGTCCDGLLFGGASSFTSSWERTSARGDECGPVHQATMVTGTDRAPLTSGLRGAATVPEERRL